jgi:hypothetical protein
MLMDKIKEELVRIIQQESVSEQEIQKRLQALEKYKNYEFQDMSEIVANKILKKEYKEQNFDFEFLRTFEDLLTAGEEIVCKSDEHIYSWRQLYVYRRCRYYRRIWI